MTLNHAPNAAIYFFSTKEIDMSTVIYGHQGCGKTAHKAALAAHFNKAQVIDGWTPGNPLPDDAMALTNVPGVQGAIAFNDAMAMLTAA